MMKSKTKENLLKSAVRSYIRARYSPIPVPNREKAPRLRGWQKLRITEDQVDENFSGSGNVGLLLGKPSRGLVDVDLDVPEAAAVADLLLPRTAMVHGRKSKPRSHRYYRIGNPPAPAKFTDVDGSCLLEIRSTGQQTIVPPSVHPSGERIRWVEEGSPKKLKAEELISRVKIVAASTILARHYPEQGTRHQVVLALAGMLLQSDWSVEDATKFISATARAARDEEWRARARNVASTAQRIAEKEPVTGATRLRELVSIEVVARVEGWLGLRAEIRPESEREHLTDLGNARRFVAQHAQHIRHCHQWRKWLFWDGTCWRIDKTGEVERRAKDTVRKFYAEASFELDDGRREKLGSWARASESRGRIAAMIDLARSEPQIPVCPSELDADPWLFNCENGTIDLRTGKLLGHNPGNLCTKIAPVIYDPDAKCPPFRKFLRRIFDDNGGSINFVQRGIGYSLTGDAREEVIFICYGHGMNGKTTLLETIRAAFGDYARTADSSLLMARNGDGVRNDVARLAGARLVSTAETEAGRRLAEVLVKQLTGRDTITARFLYSEFFEFNSQFKVFLSTNHKPTIRGTDYAIWRRIRLLPFRVTIPEDEQDKALPQKLRDELPGILAWAVRGCLRWQKDGLGQPEEVSAATEAYREEMDVFGAFLKDRCIVNKKARVKSAALYSAYKAWCEDSGERPLTQQKLGTVLAERQFKSYRTGRIRFWLGLDLRDMGDGGDVSLR
jgi:putative DNA primase/helicase